MPAPPPEVQRLRPSFMGMTGLACVLFLDLGSATLLGAGWTIGLCVLWLVLLLIGVRRFMTQPRVVLMLPLAGLAAWVVGVLVRR
jgi:hypothetical protein